MQSILQLVISTMHFMCNMCPELCTVDGFTFDKGKDDVGDAQRDFTVLFIQAKVCSITSYMLHSQSIQPQYTPALNKLEKQ